MYRNKTTIEEFEYIKRTINHLYVIRWDKVDNEDGTCDFNECTIDKKPTYPVVVELLVRQRYSESDELAMARQQYSKLQDYIEYNEYVEWCKEEAARVTNSEYTKTYEPTGAEIIAQLRTLMREEVEQLSDDDAQNVPSLFEPWEPNEAVIVDDRRYYAGKLWKCLQSHTTQASWTPDVSPSLWVRVYTEEWPEWHQPQGVQDAYMTGDKVTFEGTHYVSLIDNNTWSPDAYPQGWEARP